MLRKIVEIKNVAKFLDYRCSGQVDFRRLTLIAAPNGRGKSTLCAIVRSLDENRPEFILERTTLDPDDQLVPEVHILVDGGECRFQNGAWEGESPSLMIFDTTFIHQNVFTGDHVTSGHRRGLLDVILGRQGVELAAHVRTADQRLRSKDGEIRDAEREVVADRGEMPLDDFLGLEVDQDIEMKIAEAETRSAALSRTSELKNATGLTLLTIPRGTGALRHILGATIDDVAADAEASLSEHIDKHRMHQSGKEWITTGLNLIGETNECPFCGQGLDNNDLLAAYSTCFSEGYRNLRASIAEQDEQTTAARKAVDLAVIQKTISDNEAATIYWREAGVTVELPQPGTTDEAKIELAIYFDAAEALLSEKRASPLDIVSPNKEFREAVGQFRQLRRRWQVYNAVIKEINQQIEDFKAELDADALQPAREHGTRLKAQRLRQSETIAAKCDTITRLRCDRDEIVADRDQSQVELGEYNDTVMPSYSRNVNTRLSRFGVEFRICDLRKTERGRSPNALYQIEINRVQVALGAPDEAAGTPSFRCTLSAGEKTALAFALFMGQVEAHQNKDALTVIFDDPFSSMDAFRLEQTATQIRRLTSNVKQVVVFSHSSEFLARVHDGYRDAAQECRLLQIARRDGGGSRIEPWNIVESKRNTYEKHFIKLRNFQDDGDGEPLDVILRIRQTLEFDLRGRFGSALDDASWLGDMIGLIRGAADDSVLYVLNSSIETLEDINDYIKRYYHGNEPREIADHPPIDDTELLTHVGLALDFVHPPQT